MTTPPGLPQAGGRSDITPEMQDRLSGTWLLNVDESADPQEALDAARAGRGPVGARPSGGMAGGAGGDRGGNPEAMRATMRLATVTPRHQELTLSDSLVTVGYTAQDVWTLPFGEKVKRELNEDLTLEAQARWDNGRLTVRRSVSGGGSVTETYMPSADGARLTVAVESSLGGPGGVEFRRVYDAEPRD